MSKKPTFDDVRAAVMAIRDRLGTSAARAALEAATRPGAKLAEIASMPDKWQALIDQCAKIEATSPPPPVSSRPLVQHKPSDLPPNAVPLTLYMGVELWTKLNDARPDNVPLHVYVRGLLEAVYK